MDTVAVKDASVLIDLVNGELLERWFSLGFVTLVTDSVLAELKRGEQYENISSFVSGGEITIDRIEEGNAVSWLEKVSEYSEGMKISFADATSVICAETHKAILVTGDARMRKGAFGKKIKVRGVLWILDLLIWNGKVDFEIAIESLVAILDAGARLPEAECQKRMTAWDIEAKIKPTGS